MFDALLPEAFLEDMVTFVSTAPAMNGDMLESSSPADILFWVIHLGVDRMLAAKRLPGVTSMGGSEIVKWAPVDGSNETWLDWSYYHLDEGEISGVGERDAITWMCFCVCVSNCLLVFLLFSLHQSFYLPLLLGRPCASVAVLDMGMLTQHCTLIPYPILLVCLY